MFSMHALCACQGIFDCWKSKDLKLPFSAGLPYVPPTHTINLASFRDTHGGLTSLNLPLQVATPKHFRNQKECHTANSIEILTAQNQTQRRARQAAFPPQEHHWLQLHRMHRQLDVLHDWIPALHYLFIIYIISQNNVCIASQKAVLCDCTSENTRHMRCQDDERLLRSFLPCSHSISTTQWCRKVLLPLKLCRMKVTLNLVKKLSWHCHTVTATEEIWQNIM